MRNLNFEVDHICAAWLNGAHLTSLSDAVEMRAGSTVLEEYMNFFPINFENLDLF